MKKFFILVFFVVFSNLQAEVPKSLSDESSADELTMLNMANKKDGKLVEITVEAVEIKNNRAREMGIRWIDTLQIGEISYTREDRVPTTMPELPSLFRIGEFARLSAITADIKLMMDKGAARLLSNPKIITKSGTNARFMVGGEVPYIVITQDGPNVEWKDYGIKMNIVPTVISDNMMGLSVFTEVSDLDWENGAVYSSMKVPAVITRKAASTVKVKSGETVAIAKLLRTFKQQTSYGIPLLGEIPVLKYLFGHQKITDDKTKGIAIEEEPY